MPAHPPDDDLFSIGGSDRKAADRLQIPPQERKRIWKWGTELRDQQNLVALIAADPNGAVALQRLLMIGLRPELLRRDELKAALPLLSRRTLEGLWRYSREYLAAYPDSVQRPRWETLSAQVSETLAQYGDPPEAPAPSQIRRKQAPAAAKPPPAARDRARETSRSSWSPRFRSLNWGRHTSNTLKNLILGR